MYIGCEIASWCIIYIQVLFGFNLQVEYSIMSEFEEAGIEVESRTFKTNQNPTDVIEDLFVSQLQTNSNGS